MKSFITGLTALLSLFLSFGAFAQEKSFEVGAFSNSASISSNPVSGFSASGKVGFGANLVVSKIPQLPENLDVLVGFSNSTTNLKLTGVNLGNVDTNTFSGGLRYNFPADQRFKPYIGMKLRYSTIEGNLANNTIAVRSSSGSSFGTMFEAGVIVPIGKNFFIDYVKVGMEYFPRQNFILETSASGAKFSDVGLGTTKFGISIDKNF